MRVEIETTYCDECMEEIPRVKKKDNKYIDEVRRECRKLGMDLCDRCAENILIEMQRVRQNDDFMTEVYYGN